jgi:hypothetical protein
MQKLSFYLVDVKDFLLAQSHKEVMLEGASMKRNAPFYRYVTLHFNPL